MLRISRLRPPGPAPGAGAALAARLERLCAAGIELRAHGRCAAPDRREAGHLLRGHDAGCRTVGLPVEGTARALQRWDTAGVAGLLVEALREAVREIDALGQEWSPDQAREIVGYAIAQRITPRPRDDAAPGCGSGRDPRRSRGPSRRSDP
ncbi:hypothetical protein [Leucobacter celer]|uniref:hypothetical protein n=1 Tax=Leucobacter celer TaxID=668625 RepID=UPI0006A7D651|nr:hypothetical protein [Leucobacter celer]